MNSSQNASALNSTEMEQLVKGLESLLSGPNISFAVASTSINIISNLMGASSEALASSSNKIIGIVDTVGLKLNVDGESKDILTQSLALAVKPVNGVNFQKTTFTINNSSSIEMSPRSKRSSEAKAVTSQGSIDLPATLTENLTPQQQQQASRLQFNFYQNGALFQDKAVQANESRLISGVLSCSVANLSISNLSKNITITLRNTQTVQSNRTISCVFWDFKLNGGSGGWSNDSCTVISRTENETVCGCNHLTSFGVLMDISRGGSISKLQAMILTYITYIGCGISVIFLSLTLLTYLAFEKLRKDTPSKILIHLCLALLLLNLVFLLDSWLALYPKATGLCISTAFFLHYFLLASFTWMGLEAIHMYMALVKVFNSYVSRLMLKFGLVGWGLPLIVVVIVISIKRGDNYGLISYGKFEDGTSDEFMFIVVMIQLCRIKRQNPQTLQHRNILQDIRSVSGLTVLLGLSWGFAFFAWGKVNLPFMYLFAIFNSLQGFFIFIFHCAVKENVRRQWRMYLCCGKLRLTENSDWSNTATQKTKNLSAKRSPSFRSMRSDRSNQSSNSRTCLVNNGAGPDRTMGISSPLDDTTIRAQERPEPDVVLNEINHRHRRYQ
ncbi:adhesion G-protein coupled receptor G2-like isoform X2 [Trichomycterus rosablanca]|uniref:adhesion G-protein coupled receptor G2-like isoform X2 n=1 Tax=Trichomycterus rosablanca TaxID=2290929 RepID=UPI002F3559DF